jgi:hypothetical protein
MKDQDTLPTHGLTLCQIYGVLFRRGVRHAGMGVGYYYKGENGKVDLGNDMLKAYEITTHLQETSGGRD